VLGKWYELTVPLSPYHSAVFYQKNKTVIDFESKLYGEIHQDRKVLGGDKEIHKIKI
jgi:hypothetical protein